MIRISDHFQRPSKQEDDDLGEDQELPGFEVHATDPMGDDVVPAKIGEDGGKGPGANEQPAHHGRGLGGQEDAFLELLP